MCNALAPALVGSLAAPVQGCQCCSPWKPSLEFKARCLWGKVENFGVQGGKKVKGHGSIW